jgi:hypothetical protein
MQRLRTITGFVRVLIALFLVAQFAGVVSSPLASADAFDSAVASHAHLHHMHHHAGAGRTDRHDDQDRAHPDNCCALHAFFAGVLPAAIVVEIVNVIGRPMAVRLDGLGFGVAPDRLDRPPRPFAPI